MQEDWATRLLAAAREREEEVGHDVETGTYVRGPRMPDSKIQTETEVDEHRLSRFPIDSWCALYVRGRG